MGVYPGGVNVDITTAATGTVYVVTNPAIATVSPNGLVQAVSPGTVIVQASNSGAQALVSISVNFGAAGDTDGDGIPDAFEIGNGLNPNDPTDALMDADNDGLTN